LQPLDVSVNGKFKQALKNIFNEWRTNTTERTRTNKLKGPTLELVMNWIDIAWEKITSADITNSFKHAGIIDYEPKGCNNKNEKLREEQEIMKKAIEIVTYRKSMEESSFAPENSLDRSEKDDDKTTIVSTPRSIDLT